MTDIWHFHQSEKLYNLRVLKEILTQICSAGNSSCGLKHIQTFKDVFKTLDEDGQLKISLMKQFESLIDATVPTFPFSSHNELVDAWAHFNLRQQCEILQILLLYFHYNSSGNNQDVGIDAIDLLKIFTRHKFGSKRLTADKLDNSLVESIGQLQSILIVFLLDLPGLTDDAMDVEFHSIWKSSSLVQDLDKNIGSNLGNLRAHGPPMLAWMLSHYLVSQQIQKHKHLGQRAFQLEVVEYLSHALLSDAVNSNQVISAITYGVVYSLLSIMVTAFDPSRMNLSSLIGVLVKKEVIANVVWKEIESSAGGLASHIGTILNSSPVDSKSVVELLRSLSSASKSSAEEVFHHLNNKEIFAEPVEEALSHFVETKGDKFVNLSARRKVGLVLANGTYGSVSPDGKYYLWKVDFNGFKVLFGQLEGLLAQVLQGTAKNISGELLDLSVEILGLMENLLKKCKSKMYCEDKVVEKLCLSLIDRFVHVPNPPIKLLAVCLRCLSTMPGDSVWKSLTESGLFPYLNTYRDLNPGVIGTLLAQQECVLGTYPLTSAYLELLLQRKQFHHSILFVVEEILPSYQNWRYQNVIDKEKFGQKVLKVCSMYHDNDSAMKSLMKPLPNQTLINIASTGDRFVL